jgi:hypothetical protein
LPKLKFFSHVSIQTKIARLGGSNPFAENVLYEPWIIESAAETAVDFEKFSRASRDLTELVEVWALCWGELAL